MSVSPGSFGSVIAVSSFIDKATSEDLVEPNWTANFALCEVLNASPPSAKEALSRLKKKVKHKKSRVQLLALTLLESVVKNCSSSHAVVASKEYQKTLCSLATAKKTEFEVREKVVDMVQLFAESFRHSEWENQFEESYITLKRNGIDFPMAEVASKPFILPTAQSSRDFAKQIQPTDKRPTGGRSGGLESSHEKAQDAPQLFAVTTSNTELLEEMLDASNPGNEEMKDIIEELVRGVKQNQKQIQEKIQSGGVPDDLLEAFLTTNDNIIRVTQKHEDLLKGKTVQKKLKQPEPSLSDLLDSGSDFSQEHKPLERKQQSSIPMLGAPPDKIVVRPRKGSEPGFGSLSLNPPKGEQVEEDDPFAAIASRNLKPLAPPPHPKVQQFDPFSDTFLSSSMAQPNPDPVPESFNPFASLHPLTGQSTTKPAIAEKKSIEDLLNF